MKARSDKIPMVGNRYGDLLVLADEPWLYYRSSGRRTSVRRMVRVRCSCGRVYVTGAQPIREGKSTRCRPCHMATAHERGIASSVRLPDGVTIAEIAALTGVKLNTVYVRYLRGWPRHRLGEVTQQKGGAR